MFLSDKQLARIPIAPRAKAMRPLTKPVVFLVAKDPAVMAIARMVIAGLDKKYHIHPDYRALLKIYGKEKTRELIEGAVAIPGACDIIQTNMCYGGIGLFGGLAKNSSRFTFYEWTDGSFWLLSVSMTRQEARDIVSGKKRTIVFSPKRFRVNLRINPFRHRDEKLSLKKEMKRSHRSRLNERIYTKDIDLWFMPRDKYYFGKENEETPKFLVIISGKPYDLAIGSVSPSEDENGKTPITLNVNPSMLSEVRIALASDKGWKLRSRYRLSV